MAPILVANVLMYGMYDLCVICILLCSCLNIITCSCNMCSCVHLMDDTVLLGLKCKSSTAICVTHL